MKKKILWASLVTMLAMFTAGCSSSSDSVITNPTNPNVSAYPTAVDSFEGAGGDNTVATAKTAVIGTSQSRTIYPASDIDYIKVDLIGGTAYEFSANHLSVNSDSYMVLYAADGTTMIDSNDDTIFFDSSTVYTPIADETVYVSVEHLDNPRGVLRYTFNAHEYIDADADTYSSFYDCNDSDATIAPWEIDIPGDGIDQDCTGVDVLAADAVDASEPDETPVQAKTLLAADHFVGEVIFMGDIETANMRTIFPAGDVDWFKAAVPAYSAVEFDFGDWNYAKWSWMLSNLPFVPVCDAYSSEILTNPTAVPVVSGVGNYENSTATDETLYLQCRANDPLNHPTGVYTPVVWSYGTDKDGDGAYTKDWAWNYDCNDNDATIYSGAIEILGDGIDQNCDGVIE